LDETCPQSELVAKPLNIRLPRVGDGLSGGLVCMSHELSQTPIRERNTDVYLIELLAEPAQTGPQRQENPANDEIEPFHDIFP
jgi:hypothetical protein